jgi:hypothetical protein
VALRKGFKRLKTGARINKDTNSKTVGIVKSFVADGGEIQFKQEAIAGNRIELNIKILRTLAQDFKFHNPTANKIGTIPKPKKAIPETNCRLMELVSASGTLPSSRR